MPLMIYRAVDAFFNVFIMLVMIRCVISWLNVRSGNFFIRFVFETTEPILKVFRDLLFKYFTGPVDFSPVFAVIAVNLVRRLVLWLVALLF